MRKAKLVDGKQAWDQDDSKTKELGAGQVALVGEDKPLSLYQPATLKIHREKPRCGHFVFS
jgi:hypothetical protein